LTKDFPPKVLISYSWESDDHKAWVRELAERLRLNGIDVRLDQWHVIPGQSLTQFMESEIVGCEKALIICTPDYYKKSLARKGGVGYEQQIISGNIASGVPRDKFIPIVREGEFEQGENCAIPPHFSGIYAIDLRAREITEGMLESVLRAVYGEQEFAPPPIGRKPDFTELKNDDFSPLRLATLVNNGYELSNAEDMHSEHPETFYLPSEEERTNLLIDDTVKLIFQIAVEPDERHAPDGEFGERMWVQVKGKFGPYYVGTLDNNPITTTEQNNIIYDDLVVFLPEHVIDIHEETEPRLSLISRLVMFIKLKFSSPINE
jgi:hypothetical protein